MKLLYDLVNYIVYITNYNVFQSMILEVDRK